MGSTTDAGVPDGADRRNMPADDERNQLRQLCWDYAVHAFSTSYIFQQRAQRLRRRLLWITYIGTAVPFIIGLLALTFGAFGALHALLIIGASVLIPQAIINLWAIVGAWVELYSYANSSASANDSLASGYRQLGANPPEDTASLKREYDVLRAEDKSRREQDMQQHVKDSEMRMGMRAALRQFRRRCAGCNEVPNSMEPTECPVCGSFKYRRT